MSWFPHALILYSLGCVMMLLTVSMEEMGRYFFKFIGLVAMLLALAGVMGCREHLKHPDLLGWMLIAYGVSVFAFNVLARFASPAWVHRFLCLMVLIGGIYLGVYSFRAGETTPLSPAVLGFVYLTSAWLLGVSLVTMILGHWYLVNAQLSFDILKRCTRYFIGAIVLKFILAAVMGLFFMQTILGGLTDFTGLWIGVRVGVGLVMTLVLAIMVYKCAKIGSNQSATGIMYVETLFVLMGEMASMYLTAVHSIPM